MQKLLFSENIDEIKVRNCFAALNAEKTLSLHEIITKFPKTVVDLVATILSALFNEFINEKNFLIVLSVAVTAYSKILFS